MPPSPLPPSTPRLTFAHLDPSSSQHCEFIVSLYNSPLFLSKAGKSGVDTPAQAERLIRKRFLGEFERNGYGTWLVLLKPDASAIASSGPEGKGDGEDTLIGTISLTKGDGPFSPTAPDVGFALLPEYTGKGYATEAARAVLEYAERELGVDVVFGFTDPDNAVSRRVMERIGMEDRGTRRMKCFGPGKDGDGIESAVYVKKGTGSDLTVYGVGV